MSQAEENWQTTRPTIRERAKFTFNNDRLSDVKFVVPKVYGKIESKEAIPAHKFVLSISSPVFEAMFYGELAETKDSIELPDCDYEGLLEFFRDIYSDEVNLSGSNVMGVLYLAKKYIVPSLAEKCTNYLIDNINASNVFSVLPVARKYGEKNLVDRCWKVIDEQTEEAVNSDGFAIIDRCLLEAVVKRDKLNIDEVGLFQAVDVWAIKECERQGLPIDGEVKRGILGDSIITAFRFPLMDQVDFANVVVDSNILTPEEVINFFKCYNSAKISPLNRFSRFQSVVNDSWNYEGDVDGIDLTVDKDIQLHGLCLLGNESNGEYSVIVEIKESGSNSTLVSKVGTFSSQMLHRHSRGSIFHGFDVLFDSPVSLEKNTKYEVEAVISGPPSWRGSNGVTTIVYSGVTFSFANNLHSFNGTTISGGQFAEILFSLVT